MRFAVKGPNGLFLSDHEIVGTIESVEKDAAGNKSVHDRHLLKPVFGATAKSACKFDTEKDALDAMNIPRLQDPNAFAGCTVESVPDFNG